MKHFCPAMIGRTFKWLTGLLTSIVMLTLISAAWLNLVLLKLPPSKMQKYDSPTNKYFAREATKSPEQDLF